MGALRKVVRLGLPTGRVGMALWGWQHRHEIAGWAGWAARSAPRLAAGDTGDLLVEGRLRARLTANKRTRNVDGLRVQVQDGVAHLSGMVSPEVHDAALEIATNTAGVVRVRDEITEPGRRRARP
jgi:osmotically-inducible protein OsmY